MHLGHELWQIWTTPTSLLRNGYGPDVAMLCRQKQAIWKSGLLLIQRRDGGISWLLVCMLLTHPFEGLGTRLYRLAFGSY